MPIQFDTFDQQKIDRLKNHLESQAKKGYPKYYEIFVDSLKAVPKTDEPEEFEDYENYMTVNTYQVKVVIYNSGNSPRNDQYVFSLNAKNSKEALDIGLDGVPLQMLTKADMIDLKVKRDNYLAESRQIKELRDEIDGLEKELESREEYITILENAIERAKANGNKIGGIDIGQVLGSGVGYLLKNNAKSLSEIPGLGGIVNMFTQTPDSAKLTDPTPPEQTQASFSKKATGGDEEAPPVNLTEEEKQLLILFKNIRKNLEEEEFFDLLEVIDRLSINKEHLPKVLSILKSNNEATE